MTSDEKVTCGCPQGYIQEGIPCGCCGKQAEWLCDVFFMCEGCRLRRDVATSACERLVDNMTNEERAMERIVAYLSNTEAYFDSHHARLRSILQECDVEVKVLKPPGFVEDGAPARGISQRVGVRSGAQVFTGTRIPVATIKGMACSGRRVEQIRELFPQLSLADIAEAARTTLLPRLHPCPCECGAAFHVIEEDCGCESARDCEGDRTYPLVMCDDHDDADLSDPVPDEPGAGQTSIDEVNRDIVEGMGLQPEDVGLPAVRGKLGEKDPNAGGLTKVCAGCGADIGTGYSWRSLCATCAEPHLNPDYSPEPEVVGPGLVMENGGFTELRQIVDDEVVVPPPPHFNDEEVSP